MAIKKVLMLGNPLLREKSSDITDFKEELNRVSTDLKDTLTHLQETQRIGRALAAPQIGYMKNVVFMQIPGRTTTFVNPRITRESKEIIHVWDSCFSFGSAFFVNIERHKSITVEYRDNNNRVITEEFHDDLSELLQHEFDHLEGILATDHLKDVTKIIMREEWESKKYS
jgi:peptide deformylase